MEIEAVGKKLFVCTKPYQYLIARLIKEGCGFADCELVILNHFHKAEQFSERVRALGIWAKVTFIDDGMLDQFKLRLNPVRKYFFYHSWRRFLPEAFKDITEYSSLFVAHDFVAVEYAIIRKFGAEGKKAILFEEGSGNYINNSTHKSWHMRLLKKMAPWLGLPGGYFGSMRWIREIWLQRPEIITGKRDNPIFRKTIGLPLTLESFMRMPKIIRESYFLYPELEEVDELVRGHEELTVVLTDPFLDDVDNREAYIEDIVRKANEATNNRRSPVFFKQHPGERLPFPQSGNPQVSALPQKLPIELLYHVIKNNDIKRIHLVSFGSTAILNLYDLCRADDCMNVYIIDSLSMNEDDKLIASRFADLAEKHKIIFRFI
ncbi:hypothetical protein [Cohnella soli]|uniref:Capsular biosynthesis protein n=1 Tax=Cohnella soli TaxID=425005 RepID=A0ABW0HXE7_9BACL